MIRSFLALATGFIVVMAVGCAPADPPSEEQQVSTPADAATKWNPGFLPSGSMGPWSEERFFTYLSAAEIVGRGVLLEWEEGVEGVVRVENLCKGALDVSEVRLSGPTGWLEGVVPGERVVFFSKMGVGGEVLLHTRCAACGVYPYKEGLWQYISEHLGDAL